MRDYCSTGTQLFKARLLLMYRFYWISQRWTTGPCSFFHRLVLFWEDMKNGRNTISSASLIMTRQFFIVDPQKYRCPTTREVKTPVALPMDITGGHYLIWQERSRFSWNIGGQLMKTNFRLRNGVQKYPAVTFNSVRSAGFVVWQEDFGREIRLIGRHFIPSSTHTCSPSCTGNDQCVAQDTCASTSTGNIPLITKNNFE